MGRKAKNRRKLLTVYVHGKRVLVPSHVNGRKAALKALGLDGRHEAALEQTPWEKVDFSDGWTFVPGQRYQVWGDAQLNDADDPLDGPWARHQDWWKRDGTERDL